MGNNNFTIRREISISDGKIAYSAAKICVGLIVTFVALIAAWFVFGWLLTFIGWLAMAAMVVIGCAALSKIGKQDYRFQKDKPGITCIAENIRLKRPNRTDEYVYNLLLGLMSAMIIVLVVAWIATVAYATTAAYQVAPVNYIGFAAIVAVLWHLLHTTVQFVSLPSKRTEPFVRPSLVVKTLDSTALVLMIVYPLCIVAVNTGILK